MGCPVCGSAGEYLNGTPLAEARHFTARTIWAMHRLRLALCAMDRTDRARLVSALIREIEEIAEDTTPGVDS